MRGFGINLLNTVTVYSGDLRIHGLQENTWLYFLLVFFLILLGLVRIYDFAYFKELFRSVIDLNYVELMDREGKLKWNVINILLDLIFVGSVAFFIYQLQAPEITLEFWECFLWVGGGLLLHLIFTALLGAIFYTWNYIKIFLYNMVIFNRVAGVVVLPLVFITTYVPETIRPLMLKILGGLIVLYWILRMLRALFQMEGKFQHGFVYNFLYICTIEASPLIIALKLIALNLIN